MRVWAAIDCSSSGHFEFLAAAAEQEATKLHPYFAQHLCACCCEKGNIVDAVMCYFFPFFEKSIKLPTVNSYILSSVIGTSYCSSTKAATSTNLTESTPSSVNLVLRSSDAMGNSRIFSTFFKKLMFFNRSSEKIATNERINYFA